jgi:hypothetical protein
MGFVGNLVDANSDRMFATLYLDQEATPAQGEALTHIFEYVNGAYIALAGQPPLPLKTVKVVPTNFRESSDQTDYELQIPAILKEKALLKRDKSKQPLFTMPAMDVWSNIVHNAENIQYEYHDSELGKSRDYSGHYAQRKVLSPNKEDVRRTKDAMPTRRHVRHVDAETTGDHSPSRVERKVGSIALATPTCCAGSGCQDDHDIFTQLQRAQGLDKE